MEQKASFEDNMESVNHTFKELLKITVIHSLFMNF